MVVLQSMWKGFNIFWNFMDSRSESATYIVNNAFNVARKEETNGDEALLSEALMCSNK